jgi:hypothetical protein
VSPEQQALAVFWSHKRFWLLQALAIAAWIALALVWFWLPDSRVWGVALSMLLGAVVIGGGLWLIGAALLYYRNPGPIWRESLRRIPALAIWMAVLALAIWGSLRLKAPAWIWMLPAILLLPVAAQVTVEGVRGLFRIVWRPRYFPAAAVLIFGGAYLPYKLIGWHPQFSGLAMQTASLVVRFAAAYLLVVSAWLVLASLVARVRTDE